MYLKAIGAKNFLGYKSLSLDVEPGLWLIDGKNHHFAASSSNGAGKSTLQEVIAFALFGRTVRPLGRDDVIREGADYTIVWNDYVQADERNFRIERYRKHPSLGNGVKLLLDGHDNIGGRYIKDADDKIIERIGFDYDLFIRSIIIHSRITESFVSVQDRYLKMIAEKLIGMPDFKPLLERVKDSSRSIEQDIGSCENRIESLEQSLEEKRTALKKYKAELAEQKARHKELDSAVKEEKLALEKANRKLNEFEAKVKTLDRGIAEVALHLTTAEKDVDDAIAERAKYRESVIGNLKIMLELVVKQLKKYKTMPDECPECGQVVVKSHRELKLKELESESRTLNSQLAKAALVDAENGKTVAKAADVKSLLLSKLNRLERQRQDNRNSVVRNAQRVLSHKKLLKVRTRQVEDAVGPYKRLIEDAKLSIASTETKIAEQRTSLLKRKKRLLYYEFWKRGFGPQGIRSYVLDAVMPVLNRNANIYLDVLTDGQMSVKMAPTREKDDGTLGDQFTFEVSNLSGSSKMAGDSDGELASVDMAVNFAMADILESRIPGGFGFMFIDQAVDLFDTARGRKAVQLLNSKLNEEWCVKNQVPHKRTIWLITHREQLKSLIENRILVEKRNKVCRIVAT